MSKLKKIKKMVLRSWLTPFLCLLIVYPYMLSVRLKILDRHLKPKKRDRSKQHIYGHWHEDILLAFCKFSFSKVATMASFSRDGEVIANVAKMLGYRLVRGTSGRGWREAFLELTQSQKEGWDLALAVDGGRGPRHVAKPGIIHLAWQSGVEIIPIASNAKYKKVFHKSWDQMWIPYPFSPAIVLTGDPIHVFPDDSREVLERKRDQFEKSLLELKAQANAYY